MTGWRYLEVTIDRMSKSGNPIAKEHIRGSHVHVPGGKPGETVVIDLKKKHSHYTGRILNKPSPRILADARDASKRLRKMNRNRKNSSKRYQNRTKRRPKPVKKSHGPTKASPSLQSLGKKLGGISKIAQDKDSMKGRGGTFGRRDDGRNKRSEVAMKYD